MDEARIIDETDCQILTLLQENARITNADIARAIGMVPSAILERVRKLEERGVVAGYRAVLCPQVLNRGVLAFVLVRVASGGWAKEIGEQLAALQEVQEVHHIAGEDCFLVKVRVRDTSELGGLLRTRFEGVGDIGSTRTTIVLETVKETSAIPIECPKPQSRGGRRERAKAG